MSSVMDDEPERERPPGTIEFGLWCNRCLLPSGCRIKVGAEVENPTTGEAVRLDHVGSCIICIDCRGVLDEDGNVIRG